MSDRGLTQEQAFEFDRLQAVRDANGDRQIKRAYITLIHAASRCWRRMHYVPQAEQNNFLSAWQKLNWCRMDMKAQHPTLPVWLDHVRSCAKCKAIRNGE